ncbi:MAG: hypothetical protein ABI880_11880 [Acidobacteriota bacterium]
MTDGNSMASRMSRLETRQNSMARDIDVLKTDVSVLKTDLKALSHEVRTFKNDVQVRFEHVDERFDRVVEAFESLREQMDRRFDEADAARIADRQMFYDILGNHEGRASLEGASGQS